PDTGLGAATITDMNLVAEKEGFIVVYPNGIDRQWNYVQGVPFFDQAEQDDFSFIRSLIADLSKNLSIDPSRLYVTGFSNGGFMVNRLACEMPDQFAAFASVGGSIFTGFEAICPNSTGVNMLIMHGTLDISIPWNGLPENYNGQTIYSAMPVNDVVSFWGVRNDCAQSPEIEVIPESGHSPGTHVEIVRLPCDEELMVYVIFGGGHNWPGVPGRISERIAGAVNMDIHGSEVIWEFFSRHTREVEE
ncbi:MAG: prolyl oligopeptidase family serine peptidase, partial [Anaerolineae bacterium]|nr:prolyl oligopeptidase family serine peptidase [Anaerolineae bacterium]